MSNLSNIGNSIYEFDFSLTRVKDDNNYEFIPISKAMILYLEIEDNLSKFGCQGRVIFNNFYSILDKLGLGAGVNQGITLFDINFKNKDFDNQVSIIDKAFQIVTQLGAGDDDSNNPIDKNLNYQFEEYVVRLLREQKVDPASITSSKVTDIIKNLLSTGIDRLKKNVYVDFSNFKDSSVTIPIEHIIKPNQSFYDLISICYKYLWYPDDNSPGLLQLENFKIDDTKIQRKFTMHPLFTDIKKFHDKIAAGEKDLKEYVIEQFTIGGESDSKTIRDNTIEKYNVCEADLETLLRTTWVNHRATYLKDGNITDTNVNTITYDSLRELFIANVLNKKNQSINVPADKSISNNLQNAVDIITRDYVCDFRENSTDPIIIEAGIKAMVTRSFIFDNSAINFRTIGSPYRKPGMFILLNENTPDDKKSPFGYWFVISVKHIFENDIYHNEITAVKFCITDK